MNFQWDEISNFCLSIKEFRRPRRKNRKYGGREMYAPSEYGWRGSGETVFWRAGVQPLRREHLSSERDTQVGIALTWPNSWPSPRVCARKWLENLPRIETFHLAKYNKRHFSTLPKWWFFPLDANGNSAKCALSAIVPNLTNFLLPFLGKLNPPSPPPLLKADSS